MSYRIILTAILAIGLSTAAVAQNQYIRPRATLTAALPLIGKRSSCNRPRCKAPSKAAWAALSW